MMIIPSINQYDDYGRKDLHLLRWGINEFVKPGYKVGDISIGGSCQRLENQDLDKLKGPMFVFGNIWVHKNYEEQKLFHKPIEYEKRNIEWYYWDNPELPHLLYSGAHNPGDGEIGFKNWARMVPNSTATQFRGKWANQYGAERIDEILHRSTRGQIRNWHEVVGPRRDVKQRSNKVLLCPSGGEVFKMYYNDNKESWIERITYLLTQRGYEVHLRKKRGRRYRESEYGHDRLYRELHNNDWAFTVCNHSVIPVESMLIGTPCLYTGVSAGGNLATPWQEFVDTNKIRPVEKEQVDGWVNYILHNTFHKKELYNGSWKNA